MNSLSDTIVALATPPGVGAIGIIRLSGSDAISIADQIFKGKRLAEQAGHTIHFGHIVDGQKEVIDEVVVSLFRAPRSYTGQDVIEISCHGSDYILGQVIEQCAMHGATLAQPGEFTQRAFLNGKLDLTQSEAVADLIASQSSASHRAAMHQLRGGFSSDLKIMREELITFSALIELELDFSQEDVEFADRAQLMELLARINSSIDLLIQSFKLGNAVRNGVSVAIIGKPNAGKSTLLNALLNDERAIVSDIPGTTRDTIEEVINLEGILFRFIDTAGIRANSSDLIEQKGIERSLHKAASADIVISLIDGADTEPDILPHNNNGHTLTVINKVDLLDPATISYLKRQRPEALFLTAKNGIGIDELKARLQSLISSGTSAFEGTLITNARHHQALQRISEAISDIRTGLEIGLSSDLLSHHIRQALHYIGELTGEVQVDRDILGAIFGKFCIGK